MVGLGAPNISIICHYTGGVMVNRVLLLGIDENF